MARVRSKKREPRRAPLIKRVLMLPPYTEDEEDNSLRAAWETVHYSGSNTEALKFLQNFSYDTIIINQEHEAEDVLSYLIDKYPYDSVIVLYGGKDFSAPVAMLREAGYVALCVDDLALLTCTTNKLIREGKWIR